MKSNYKRLGDYIREVKNRNSNLSLHEILGINIDKYFMPSVANVIGTDISSYKTVKKGQFACNLMHVGRDKRLPVALSDRDDFIVSPAYIVFEIIDTNVLDSDYLMMWFMRSEFDRNVCFYTDADVRGGLSWHSFLDMSLPIPAIEKQREIVAEYKAVQRQIDINNKLIQKLEETAQAIYKQWFVDFEKNIFVELAEYVDLNPKIELNKNTRFAYVEMANVSEVSMCIKEKTYRKYIGGAKFINGDTLLAKITPCLENGKTAFVNILDDKEIGTGSTEFIVMRGKKNISPYWVYCLARDPNFRAYAISSMVGSSGRQRANELYIKKYSIPLIDDNEMKVFHKEVNPIFKIIQCKWSENRMNKSLINLLLKRLVK